MADNDRPTVVFDCDGVLADFCWGFSTLMVEMGQAERPHSNGVQQTWEFEDWPGWEGDAIAAAWRYIEGSSDFWALLPSLVSAQEVESVRTLAGEHPGLDFVYMTARVGETAREQTAFWLQTQGMPPGRIVIETDKVAGHDSLVAEGRRIIGTIDDRAETVDRLRVADYPIYMLDWPYNRPNAVSSDTAIGISGAQRVTSVAEFLGRVRSNLDATA